MWWAAKNLALATVVALGATPQNAHSQTSLPPVQSPPPLLTTNRTLLASLTRISEGSPLWREAMNAVRNTGRRALVVTPSDIVATGPKEERYAFDDGALAEAIPVFDETSQVVSVVVVVNVRLVQRLHDDHLSLPRDFEADLDRILVHEIYGHAVPYLLAGDATGRCADPKEGENASDACSIRRENAVRAELGLGSRSDYGLSSLTIASRLR
jgi:hypothetical protein